MQKLATVDSVPDKPEPVRQVILRGLKLGDNGGELAVGAVGKMDRPKLGQPDDKPTAALAAWQKWFSETYPNEPEPALAIETADNRWTQEELLSYLNGPEVLQASPGAAARCLPRRSVRRAIVSAIAANRSAPT